MGTIVTSLVALLFCGAGRAGRSGFPGGAGAAWLRSPLGILVELLAAVPSVVYGLWGLFAFIPLLVRPVSQWFSQSLGYLPLFQGPVFGPSRLAAGLILTIMILPTITAISRDVLRAIPIHSAKPRWRWAPPAGK